MLRKRSSLPVALKHGAWGVHRSATQRIQVGPSKRVGGTARRREREGIKPNETSNGEAPWGELDVERGNKALIPGLSLHPPPLGTQGWRAIRERDKKKKKRK